MPRSTPTSAQARILEFLCAFPGLTTRQIDDSLGTGKTRRAIERMLARLVEQSLVVTKMVQPELGPHIRTMLVSNAEGPRSC